MRPLDAAAGTLFPHAKPGGDEPSIPTAPGTSAEGTTPQTLGD